MEQNFTFACQRCKQPLKIEESLADLDADSVDILLASPEESITSRYTDHRLGIKKSSKQDIFNDYEDDELPASNLRSVSSSKNPSGLSRSPNGNISNKESFLAPSESYVMLSRSQVASHHNDHSLPERNSLDGKAEERRKADWSNRLKIANRLFDFMSSRSDIEHPMCHECTDMLLDSLKKHLADASKERDCYIDFHKKVNVSVISDTEKENLQKEIQEARIWLQNQDIEHERDALKKEMAALEDEANELDKLEESYWQEFNDFHIQLQTFLNERDSINLKFVHDSNQLEKLQKTNVYNDAFCIGLDDQFGTINGFRLGRLPHIQVDWSEINAAWGSFSKIEKIDDDTSYELYGSGDFSLKTPFLNNRFNNAMVAYLNCLQQLGDYAEQQNRKLKLPYRINKDKIGDVSIRYQFKGEETWTKALRYTLTNIKWILAYAASLASSK
ncbi:18695_t:CDS:2 [Funneliformis geosporum]|nr:18695_t:CDS:2 [Funneliformis geosporum]